VETTGLRERKKAKTRAEIRRQALRLFRERGYHATTVAQVIEEAEVSESTFFRYFPTKGDVVLTEDLHPMIVEAFRAQPPGLSVTRALRAAFQAAFAQLSPQEEAEQRDRMALALSVPELRGAMLDRFASAMYLLAEIVGERTGLRATDPSVLTLAGAVVGATSAALFALVHDPSANVSKQIDDALARLERGVGNLGPEGS
jgi:AcrR family transcriptional regulator